MSRRPRRWSASSAIACSRRSARPTRTSSSWASTSRPSTSAGSTGTRARIRLRSRHETRIGLLGTADSRLPIVAARSVRLSLTKEDRRSFQERSRRPGLVFRTGPWSARCARGCTTADNSGDAAVRPGSPRRGRVRGAPTTGRARPTSSRAQLSPIHPPDGPAVSELQERPLQDTFKPGAGYAASRPGPAPAGRSRAWRGRGPRPAWPARRRCAPASPAPLPKLKCAVRSRQVHQPGRDQGPLSCRSR